MNPATSQHAFSTNGGNTYADQDAAEQRSAEMPPFVRLAPTTGWQAIRLGEIWAYRDLLYFLTWRDVKVRYKQTFLGAVWAILQPVMTMAIFSLFFGKLAQVPSDNLPYPIFAYAALIPWTFFANGLQLSAMSLAGSANLIKKVYFPRIIVPTAAVLSGFVDFLMAFVVLIGLMVFYGIVPTVNVLFLPPLLVLAFTTSLGVGLWLSAVNVHFRDVRYVVPFLVQSWMFATPIAYPSSLVPEFWRPFYALNPMVGVVEGFRWALLGTDTSPGVLVLASSAASLAILISGAYYFRRMEKTFADAA